VNASDPALDLVRAALRATIHREVKMFGGTAFMVREHLLVAVSPRGLLVRVGPDAHAGSLWMPDTQEMIMRGRPMLGYIFVNPPPTDSAGLHLAPGPVQEILPGPRDLSRRRDRATRISFNAPAIGPVRLDLSPDIRRQ
jgi:hypothetical protein